MDLEKLLFEEPRGPPPKVPRERTQRSKKAPDYPTFKGFRNPTGSSCFIDSLLVAMFGPFIVHRDPRVSEISRNNFTMQHRGDNFWTVMLEQDIDSRITPFNYDSVCHREREKDLEIRRRIQEALRRDIENLWKGNRGECSRLRGLIGKICRLPGAPDLATGYQDPADIYDRLLKVFAYTPIWTHKEEVFGRLDEEIKTIERVCTRKNEYTHQMEPQNYIYGDLKHVYTAHAPSANKFLEKALTFPKGTESRDRLLDKYEQKAQKIKLEHIWQPEKWEKLELDEEAVIECEETGQKFRHPNLPNLKYMYRFPDSANVFVARIFRGDPQGIFEEDEETKKKFTAPIKIPNEIVLETLDFQGRTPLEVSQEVGRELENFPKRRQTYRLFSAVLHAVDIAHYITLLRVPAKEGHNEQDFWYLYDDLSQEPYKKLTDAKAQKMLETQSVMLFYFPYGPTLPVEQAPPVESLQPTKRTKQADTPQEEFSFESMDKVNRRVNDIVEGLFELEISSDIDQLRRMAFEVVSQRPFSSHDEDISMALSLLNFN